jgi:hypothetical protein
LFLAFAVVLSTGGVAISKHMCNGEVKDVAVFHEAESCEHSPAVQLVQCPVHQDMVIPNEGNTDDCCSDTTDLLKDDRPQTETKSFIIPDFQLAILYVFRYAANNEFEVLKYNIVLLHLPPLINQEITILVQSFLL